MKNEYLLEVLSNLISQHNDAFKFATTCSTFSENTTISRTLLSLAESSHYCIVDLVSYLKQLDATATFDNQVSIAEALFIGWTDLKNSMGFESDEELLIAAKNYYDKILTNYSTLKELQDALNPEINELISLHQTHLKQNLHNLENLIEE